MAFGDLFAFLWVGHIVYCIALFKTYGEMK